MSRKPKIPKPCGSPPASYRTVRVPSAIIDALRRGVSVVYLQGERGIYRDDMLMFDELAPGTRWALRHVVSAEDATTGTKLVVRDDGVNP